MLTASKSLENLEAEGGLSEGEEEEGEEAKRSENGCSVDGGESGGGDDDSTTSRALKPWSVCFLCSLPVLLVVMCAWRGPCATSLCHVRRAAKELSLS